MYKVRCEMLGMLEKQSEAGEIDLFYGDESQVAESGYVPYGWIFKDESGATFPPRGTAVAISLRATPSAGTTPRCSPNDTRCPPFRGC